MREGPTTKRHKENKKFGKAAIITLSDSRTIKEDDSGDLIAELLEKSGHRIADRTVIPDNEASLRSKIKSYTSYAEDQDIINIIIIFSVTYKFIFSPIRIRIINIISGNIVFIIIFPLNFH